MTILHQYEREEIAEILKRRANEVAKFSSEHQENPSHFGSTELELALTREVTRLRDLADRINPPEKTR